MNSKAFSFCQKER